MPSTFSSLLRLELPADGEQLGIWGRTTNRNLGALIETAITGQSTVPIPDTNVTLTAMNGQPDQSRSAALRFTGTLTAPRVVTVPAVTKIYVVFNDTNRSVGLKTATGTTFNVPAGAQCTLFCDGVNFDLTNNFFTLIQGLQAPMLPDEATNKAYVDGLFGTAQSAQAQAQIANDFAQFVNGTVPGFAGQYSSREWATGTFVPDGSSKEWATQLTTPVDGTEYSAKEYAIGNAVPTGSSREWAVQVNVPVEGTNYSAKEWAVGITVPEGSSKFWANVAQTSANFQGVYNPATVYQRGQTVADAVTGALYVSVVNSNQGNPLTNDNFWIRISSGASGNNAKLLFFGSF